MSQEQNAEAMLSIVVVGHMNPTIHHPYWYKLAQILTEDEVAEAIKRPVAVSPDIAFFDTGSIRISCTRERWEIAALSTEFRHRMASIAAEVFDVKLKETPIDLVAFNNDSRHQVAAGDVASLLASRSAGVWGLAKFTPTGAAASVQLKGRDGGRINIRIEPALDASGQGVPGKLFIAVNLNHSVRDLQAAHAAPASYIDLRKVLDDHLDADFKVAQECAAAIVASLSERAEG